LPAGTSPWTPSATLLNSDHNNEESWVKLPDGSILSYEMFGTQPQTAQRFVPGTPPAPGAAPAPDQWVSAGQVPDTLSTVNGGELGAGVLSPDGRVFFLGATSDTALYTPPSAGNPTGTWAAGPTIPFGLGANDAPAAVLPNGHVLFAASDTPQF